MTTESIAAIADHLERLADIGDAAGMHSLAREIRDERLPALREGRMSMVVLGEFNHGKSTTINALLGESVLPTGITPTTSVITHIRHGDGPARVVRDERVDEVDTHQLRDLIVNDAPDDLRFVEIEVASPMLSKGLTVVDTPGVNDISQQKVEITYGYVPRADVVVYVLDATQALKRSEITFIQDRLLRNALDRLFFVIGKVDALSEDELAEILTHVKARLGELIGDVPIFPVSARRAVHGGDEGFDTFRAAITSYLDEQQDAIVVDGALRTGMRLSALLDQNLAIEQSAMRLETHELDKRIESVRERLSKSRQMVSSNIALIEDRTSDIAAAARDNIETFVREFSAALPREIDKASTDDIKRYLPDFVHDTFKDFLEAEGTHVAMKLELLAEEIISITNRNLREVMQEVEDDLGVPSRDINLEVDTFGYDVGVFALGALGVTFLAFSNLLVGGLLTLSAPILAFVMKDRVEDTIREKAREQGLEAVQKAGETLTKEMDEIVADFRDKLGQFVENAGDRLYRQIMEALDRVRTERASRSDDHAPIEADLAARREDVAAVTRALLDLKATRAAEVDEASSTD